MNYTFFSLLHPALVGNEDSLFYLSHDVRDAEESIQQCLMVGGYLATVWSDQLQNKLMRSLKEKYDSSSKQCILQLL